VPKVLPSVDAKLMKKSRLFERDVTDAIDMPFTSESRIKDIDIPADVSVSSRSSPRKPNAENGNKDKAKPPKSAMNSRYTDEEKQKFQEKVTNLAHTRPNYKPSPRVLRRQAEREKKALEEEKELQASRNEGSTKKKLDSKRHEKPDDSNNSKDPKRKSKSTVASPKKSAKSTKSDDNNTTKVAFPVYLCFYLE
jgi:hypothetical protein